MIQYCYLTPAGIKSILGEVPKFIEDHSVNKDNPISVKYHDIMEFCSWRQPPAEDGRETVNMFSIIRETLDQHDFSRYLSIVEVPSQVELQDLSLVCTNIRDSYSSIVKEECSQSVS